MAAIAVRRKPQNQRGHPVPPKRGIVLTAEDVERILLSLGRRMRAEAHLNGPEPTSRRRKEARTWRQ